MGSWIVVFPVLQELEELLCAPFFKQAHELAPDCLHLSTGDLLDLAIAVDKASCDLLEF